MNAYCIFDDFGNEAIEILENAGINVTLLPRNTPRPEGNELKKLLENYDALIIGTSQKLTQSMFDNISSKKIISTASIGIDHIDVPESKKQMVKICNTPTANAISVAEYIVSMAFMCSRRIVEGSLLYRDGKNNKNLFAKPNEIFGKTIGIVGAGNISQKLMEYAAFLGMRILCWTKNPEKHSDLLSKGVNFVSLMELASDSDVISVNLPNLPETEKLIDENFISKMNPNAIFISVSRLQTIDYKLLIEKAKVEKNFYLCLDIDVDENVVSGISGLENVFVTPHIAGGTVESRKRMFIEAAKNIVQCL